jgi:aminopeptidase N
MKSILRFFIPLILLSLAFTGLSQDLNFGRQDSLRGMVTPERIWWDLDYYQLFIKVDPEKRFIEGNNRIQYRVLQPKQRMQIDLQPPMEIGKVTQDGEELAFEREGNVYYITLAKKQEPGSLEAVEVSFSGHPKTSRRPPWDGGFTWQQDSNGKPFIATSVQGEGASLFWPCKDHMYDEPDSMLISVSVPNDLMNVSNGQLRGVGENKDGTKTWSWFVANPINNYGVNINIGDYAHFSETYKGEKGKLDCDYYVLQENLDKAKEQFKQVPMMLEAFEHWFGPYPFYEDGYKLVEVPYLGMEHQSSVTYGNEYKNGYRGTDLSNTGWGMKFDFIIIHESGHEWFANNITYKDMADMWIHEGFTAYSENLYLDYHYGQEAASDYVIGTRSRIQNDRPVIGYYNVNYAGSGDMYYKGANMLHTLRQIVNNDEQWRVILRGLNETFYHQTVTTQQIEDYLSEKTGRDLRLFFDQYLRTTQVPTLEYKLEDGKFHYRWSNCVRGFKMPVKVYLNGEPVWLRVQSRWQRMADVPAGTDVQVDRNFYVGVFNILGE